MGLSPKQKAFVNHYVLTKNATKSAIAAKYSKKAARQAGSELLSNPAIKAEIARILDQATIRAEMKAEDILRELQKLAFVDITLAYDEDGKLRPLKDLPEDIRKALVAVESSDIYVGRGNNKVKVGKAHSVRMTDKMRALELLAKHFKLLTDVTEHKLPQGGAAVVFYVPKNGSEAEDPEKK